VRPIQGLFANSRHNLAKARARIRDMGVAHDDLFCELRRVDQCK